MKKGFFTRWRPEFAGVLLGWWALLTSMSAMAEGDGRPLALRNVSPVAALYGLPRMQGAGVMESGTELQFVVEQVSNFTSSVNAGDVVFFDGETTVASYVIGRALRPRLEWRVEIPFFSHTGGFLDRFVDGFHDLFGLRDGGRPLAPRGQLDYFVRIDGVNYVDFQSSRRQLGDVRAALGYQIFDRPTRALAGRVQIKAPTGELESLSGSEAWDLAAWLEYRDADLLRALGLRLTAGLGAVALGDGDLVQAEQESLALVGHLGLQRDFGARFTVLAQLDSHGRLLDTGIDEVHAAALIGTLGGRVQVTDRFQLDFAVLEDLRGRSTPDVVFQLRLGVVL